MPNVSTALHRAKQLVNYHNKMKDENFEKAERARRMEKYWRRKKEGFLKQFNKTISR